MPLIIIIIIIMKLMINVFETVDWSTLVKNENT